MSWLPADGYRRANSGRQHLRRIAFGNGDFQIATGSDQPRERAGRMLAIAFGQSGYFATRAVNRQSASQSARCQHAGRNVRDQIAKAVDPAHGALDAAAGNDGLGPIERLDLCEWRSQSLWFQSQTQLCGDRSQNVAAMKC